MDGIDLINAAMKVREDKGLKVTIERTGTDGSVFTYHAKDEADKAGFKKHAVAKGHTIISG